MNSDKLNFIKWWVNMELFNRFMVVCLEFFNSGRSQLVVYKFSCPQSNFPQSGQIRPRRLSSVLTCSPSPDGDPCQAKLHLQWSSTNCWKNTPSRKLKSRCPVWLILMFLHLIQNIASPHLHLHQTIILLHRNALKLGGKTLVIQIMFRCTPLQSIKKSHMPFDPTTFTPHYHTIHGQQTQSVSTKSTHKHWC